MAEQEKLFLTELRLCGESSHWRVDVRYTAALPKHDDEPKNGDGDNQQKDGDDDKAKTGSMPEEVRLSVLVPAGDRSVVELQIAAMDRAVAFLQATANAARSEQVKLRQTGNSTVVE